MNQREIQRLIRENKILERESIRLQKDIKLLKRDNFLLEKKVGALEHQNKVLVLENRTLDGDLLNLTRRIQKSYYGALI